MDRLIDPAHPIHELHRRRWSPRAFADRTVEPAKLLSILEGARWAPSSSNEQPWYFIIATKNEPQDFERMLSCLVEQNQRWARSVPVLMITVASNRFARTLKPNRHAYYDLGQAVMAMTVEATSLGLFAHQMAGFSPDKAREAYRIPESADAVSAIALGYPGDPATLPDDLRTRELAPSQRKPLTEFVFSGRWGELPAWLK